MKSGHARCFYVSDDDDDDGLKTAADGALSIYPGARALLNLAEP